MKLIIVGDHHREWETHRATEAALAHSQKHLNVSLDAVWLSTKHVTQDLLKSADGFWIATGTPYENQRGALEAIRYARENNVPCLATCQGFQHLMLEFAETILRIPNPGHAEYAPDSVEPFISAMACSLKGQTQTLIVRDNTRASEIYGSTTTTESFYCSYGINPKFVSRIAGGGIVVSGVDANGEIRIVEYPEHPFMIGTLFVPQVRSMAGNPHPLVSALVEAVVN